MVFPGFNVVFLLVFSMFPPLCVAQLLSSLLNIWFICHKHAFFFAFTKSRHRPHNVSRSPLAAGAATHPRYDQPCCAGTVACRLSFGIFDRDCDWDSPQGVFVCPICIGFRFLWGCFPLLRVQNGLNQTFRRNLLFFVVFGGLSTSFRMSWPV